MVNEHHPSLVIVMMANTMVVVTVLWLFFVMGDAVHLTDKLYYTLPRLFELDNYQECLSSQGAFCLGSFQLASKQYNRLLDQIQEFSKDTHNFDHTLIHRGYCVSTTCSLMDGDTLPRIFEDCVHNITKTKYGLDTELLNLDYCKYNGTPRRAFFDSAEIIFASIIGLILIANIVGTAYDILRKSDNKPNPYLMTWSVCVNWNRLTATYEKGDPRLSTLDPVNGMKSLTLLLVLLAHSIIGHHMIYLLNPKFIEVAHRHPLATYVNNGTTTVQTFIVLSSFLLAYNVLLSVEADPEKKMGLSFLWKTFLHRFVRITPVSMLVVGFSATWWRYTGDGPLWSSLVEAESDACRIKWWTHALYVNNLVKPDDKCLIQTWFLAVDMQLYVLSCVLLVCIVRRPHSALKILTGLFVLSFLVNFAIAYYWELKTILFIAYPEYIRQQYKVVPSFKWFYAAPWSSAPAAILGLLLAFLYYLMRKSEYNLHANTWFRILYRCSVPGMFIWIVCGYLVKDAQSRLGIAIYTALYRPTFCILVSIAILGFFYKIDSLWWQFLSWRGWQILGRMSLSILMIHWTFTLTLLGGRPNLTYTSVAEVSANWLLTIVLTYLTSVPLHLLVELPMQKFLLTLFS